MRCTLLVTLFALAGCPDPVDPAVPGANGELAPMGPNGGAPGAPQEGAPPPGDGAPQPAGDGSVPAQPSGPPPEPPGLASLVQNGATVTVSGTIEGAKNAQVDFQFYAKSTTEEDKGAPENIEIVQVTDGTFSVKAPATYDRELYVTATAKQGDQPTPSDPSGFAGPLKLAGKDLTVTIKLAPNGSAKLPWFRDGGPMAGGTGPGAPAPGGAAAPGATAGAVPGADGMAPMNAGADGKAPAAGTTPPASAAPTPASGGKTAPTDAKAPTAPKAPATAPKTDAKAPKAPVAPK